MSFDPITYGLLKPKVFDLDKYTQTINGTELTLSQVISYSFLEGRRIFCDSIDANRLRKEIDECNKDIAVKIGLNGTQQILYPSAKSVTDIGKVLHFYVVFTTDDTIVTKLFIDITTGGTALSILAKVV